MKIQWTNSDEYYHTELEEDSDKKEAIKQLILKILELSKNRESWNQIILDKWVDSLGRLIGNIQNADQAIGLDRGYRVAIQFLSYYKRLESSTAGQYGRQLARINEEMENLIIDVLHEENFKDQLLKYHEINPFTIEISEQGQRIGLTFEIV